MKLLCLNVRGLGRSRTVNRLRHILRDINPMVVIPIETKLISCKMKRVRRKCGFPNVIDIDLNGKSGGLSIGWISNSKISL